MRRGRRPPRRTITSGRPSSRAPRSTGTDKATYRAEAVDASDAIAGGEQADPAGAAQDLPQSARAELFREAIAALASGVAVVTARRSDAHPVGLLATSVAAYSAEPPSILLAVAHSARSHPILVEEAERFGGVHLLARAQESTARVFASRVGDKFADLEWEWDGEVPRLHGVVSYLRCRRSAVYTRYDHSIVIGDVLGGLHHGGEPLLWVRRRMDWRLRPEG